MESIVDNLMTNVDHEQPLKVINFDCNEALASEQQQQHLADVFAVIKAEQEEEFVANFDLSLLDV